ncbi:MAG: VOC family protein [Fimbriiglobus sp.]
MIQFLGAYPISGEDLTALPVGDVARGVAYYTQFLGFTVVASDETRATVKRDDVQIGVIRNEHHDPLQAGSCYLEVTDVIAARAELEGRGAKPGPIQVQEYDGDRYRIFFVRECDVLDSHEGYCFCIGHPTE